MNMVYSLKNIAAIKLLISLAMAVLILSGCSSHDLPPGSRDGGFLLADPKKHQIALEEMEKHGIPYEVNDRGHVTYLLKNKAQVLGVIRKALYGETISETTIESMPVHNERERNMYETEFKKEGIPYSVIENEGVVQITWGQKYGPRVDKLRQDVDISIMDEIIKQYE